MIAIGKKYRTVENGMFNAGEDNVVKVEGIGSDWVIARDSKNKIYFAHNETTPVEAWDWDGQEMKDIP